MNRRTLLAAAGLYAAGSAAQAQAADDDHPVAPSLSFVFRAEVSLGPPLEFGVTDGVKSRLIPITGGVVRGPRFEGVVLPGGGDWQAVQPDGATLIHARYTFQAKDGALVGVDNPGVRRGPPDVLRRLAAGEAVDPASYYFRTSPTFTASGPYGWLTRSLFVCKGERRKAQAVIDFFEAS